MLAPTARSYLENLLTGAPEVGFRLLLRPPAHATPHREYRLWRSDPRIRFVGAIHEKVAPAMGRVSRADRRPIGDCELLLEHRGYEGDQTHKHLRNLSLLERELALDPDDLFNLHHLARVLEALGRVEEAEKVLERAVEALRSGRAEDRLGSLAYGELVRLRRDPGRPAKGLLDEARERYPGSYLLLFHEGRRRMDEERYLDAIPIFERLLAVDTSTHPDAGPSYDEVIFGALAHESRAKCLMRLERYEEAAAAYEAAERCAPDDLSLRSKRALAHARARAA